MSNKGNYVLSLSQFVSWLGSVAEEMGVEVYPGFAGASLVIGEHDGKKVVRGVRTNEVGLDRQERMKESFEPGMEFLAKVTLLAEGAHGSLTKTAVQEFDLRKDAEPQTYGMGVKEVWRVKPEKHQPGLVQHTMGWPLDFRTYGGTFCYHMDGGLVSLGLVVGLDYANPYLSPYRELQRLKHHPLFRNLLEGGERIAYGGRTLNEGGIQSLPKLYFPGGALIGCAAGTLNVPKIKGTHNAMKSGMVASETAFKILEDMGGKEPADMSGYEKALKESWVWKELMEVRNIRPSFNTPLGIWGGIAYSGVDSLFLKGRVPWTFKHGGSDAAHTKRARYAFLSEFECDLHRGFFSECEPIRYPPFQPPLSTDLLTSLSLTSTNHAEDQPIHLQIKQEDRVDHVKKNVGEYAGLLGHACPASVYEYVSAEPGDESSYEGQKLVINSQVRLISVLTRGLWANPKVELHSLQAV